jgi:arylsulfatase
MKKTTNLLIFFLLFQALFGEELDQRPNFLIILVDDLGFSDIGCYGSEIDTPNLDRLADNGLRFSQFYNTAKCHASRICLLTGQYYLQAGNDSLKNAVTSAEVLSNAGYHTMMSGKWHLDKEPTDFGFERYFGHLSGATNYYSGDDTFRLNGKPLGGASRRILYD